MNAVLNLILIIRLFVEYLVDTGQLEMSCQRGVVLYSRPKA